MRNKNRRKKLGVGERRLLQVIGEDIAQIIKRRGETVNEVSQRANVSRSTLREVILGESNVGLITFTRILESIECRSISKYLAKFNLIGT